jgi:hypothetical protein
LLAACLLHGCRKEKDVAEGNVGQVLDEKKPSGCVGRFMRVRALVMPWLRLWAPEGKVRSVRFGRRRSGKAAAFPAETHRLRRGAAWFATVSLSATPWVRWW